MFVVTTMPGDKGLLLLPQELLLLVWALWMLLSLVLLVVSLAPVFVMLRVHFSTKVPLIPLPPPPAPAVAPAENSACAIEG